MPNYLLELIKDYFKDRVLLYDTDDDRRTYAVLASVPQGSVLGPILWNVTYDAVLMVRLPKVTQFVEFADDIALVIGGKRFDELVRTCNTVVSTARSWIAGIDLKLSDHKADVELKSSRKRMEFITIAVCDQLLISK